MSDTVLITGAAKRIGKFLALSLAEQGYNIALHYNESETEAGSLADKIKRLGVDCEIFQADLSCPDESSKLIPDVARKFSNLNILINNASIFNPCSLIDTSYLFLKRNFDINLFAPLLLTRQFAKICRNGNIINMLDSNITKNQTAYFPYLMTKKALADLTKLSASELAPNIRVNGIAPGLILPNENDSKESVEFLISRLPLQEKAQTSEIINALNFLLKNSHITGQIVYVDSGKHLI